MTKCRTYSLFLCVCLPAFAARAQDIIITSPAAGTVVAGGDTIEIAWEGDSIIGAIQASTTVDGSR